MSSASQVLELSRNQPNLAGLGKLCESFLRNSRLQQELATLVRYSIWYSTVQYGTDGLPLQADARGSQPGPAHGGG